MDIVNIYMYIYEYIYEYMYINIYECQEKGLSWSYRRRHPLMAVVMRTGGSRVATTEGNIKYVKVAPANARLCRESYITLGRV